MDILALIPARGGSKSIPRKNIREVAGKPLIAYSIEQALGSARITRVIVSTDDREIADSARAHGAEVPFIRPSEFAQDHSPDIDVFRHALAWLLTQEGYEPGIVVHLRPTMPLRRIETINQAIEQFIQNQDADSLRSVNMASQTPFKMWMIDRTGYLEPVVQLPGQPEPYNIPRQKLPPVYWQNGYIDIVRRNVIVEMGSMTGKKILAFVINEPCIDIDYEYSLQQIERVLAGKALESEWPGSGEYPS